MSGLGVPAVPKGASGSAAGLLHTSDARRVTLAYPGGIPTRLQIEIGAAAA